MADTRDIIEVINDDPATEEFKRTLEEQLGLLKLLLPRFDFAATETPTVNYDASAGWTVGSMVKYLGSVYLCTDNTVGAAVWEEIALVP